MRNSGEAIRQIHTLFPSKPSKSQRRQLQIIHAAIELFATRGIEQTRYEDIAQKCKITRPLVQKYFPDREELFLLAMQLIRAEFQRVAVEAMSGAQSTTQKITAYVLSTYTWVQECPRHAKVWLLFYYYCGIQLRHRKANSELVQIGHDRLEAIIRQGIELGEFIVENPRMTAKIIQNIITGSLLSRVTENQVLDENSLKDATVNACLALLRPSRT